MAGSRMPFLCTLGWHRVEPNGYCGRCGAVAFVFMPGGDDEEPDDDPDV
jgi:hypothetical protein